MEWLLEFDLPWLLFAGTLVASAASGFAVVECLAAVDKWRRKD